VRAVSRLPSDPAGTLRVCLLASGSNGNSCLVEAGPTRLLVDVGLGPRTLARRLAPLGLDPAGITHVLLTHAHDDHVSGLADLVARHPEVAVLATGPAIRELPRDLRRRCRELHPGLAVPLGPLVATPFAVSHDSPGTVGFRLESPAGVLGYATDLGSHDAGTVAALAGARLLVVEANHCPRLLAAGPYPPFLKRRVAGPRGHLSNDQCRDLLERVLHPGLDHVLLAHVSAVNNSAAAVRAAVAPLQGAAPAVRFAVGSRRGPLPPIVLSDPATPARQLPMPW
jgi:phosphoribosyl 1,2-cyclic phosphodiesterase